MIRIIKKYGPKQAQADLPSRKSTDNKYNAGKVMVIAGSRGMWGAGVLAAQAAARVGAGFVYWSPLLSSNLHQQIQFSLANPDFIWAPALSKWRTLKINASVLGPGLKQAQKLNVVFKKLLKEKTKAVVLDAEALTYLAQNKKLQEKIPSTWILTPHEGELARLMQTTSAKIRANRSGWLQKAQDKFKCVVVLKGHKTLVANEKFIFEVQAGNPSLAKAGTGDVLAGMIAGFLAQGLAPVSAAALAVYAHAKIADDWIQMKNDILSLRAVDLIQELPKALAALRKTKERGT